MRMLAPNIRCFNSNPVLSNFFHTAGHIKNYLEAAIRLRPLTIRGRHRFFIVGLQTTNAMMICLTVLLYFACSACLRYKLLSEYEIKVDN